MKIKYIFTSIITLLLMSCTPTIPSEVVTNIDKSNENKSELMKAIQYFQQKGDSLQLDAVYFLIGNMEDHLYSEFGLFDSVDTEYNINVLDYPNYDSLILVLDSLELVQGELHFGRKQQIKDLETISSNLLIENIEFAFSTWYKSPWFESISYDDFKEYILPYRGSNEPLESWRKELYNKYASLRTDLDSPTNLISFAKQINEDIKSWFNFDSRYYLHPTDQGYGEMCITGLGRCEDMTNLAIYAMRANGIPVTSDYTPHWADTGNNHAWNAILTSSGKVVPFMGCESNPGEYSLRTRMAKAYRKTFSKQYDNLVFKLDAGRKAPRWLMGKYYTDVTPFYTETATITLHLDEVPDSIQYAYLCVFNAGEWKAIHWSEITNSMVEFTDMGVDIAYLPMFFRDEELFPIGNAFICQKDGSIFTLNGDALLTQSIELISTTQKTIENATEGKVVTFLENESQYELNYWDNEWKSLGEQTASEYPLQFMNVPQNRLYWLTKKDSRREERIFTLVDGKQIWW